MTDSQAPEFDLLSLGGGRRRLSDLLAAGPVLLAFYKTSCPTCQLTFPFLQRLERGRSSAAPQIVAISQDDARLTGEFNRRFGVSILTLLDPPVEGAVRYPASNAYQITNVPTLYLVEQDGRISWSAVGFDKAALERLGERFGVEVFTGTDRVPVYQPG